MMMKPGGCCYSNSLRSLCSGVDWREWCSVQLRPPTPAYRPLCHVPCVQEHPPVMLRRFGTKDLCGVRDTAPPLPRALCTALIPAPHFPCHVCLQGHSLVMLRGGNTKDLRGVRDTPPPPPNALCTALTPPPFACHVLAGALPCDVAWWSHQGSARCALQGAQGCAGRITSQGQEKGAIKVWSQEAQEVTAACRLCVRCLWALCMAGLNSRATVTV